MDIYTIITRFAITFVFSIIFGLERQRSHKPIGFGTFIFVAVGSCGLAIVAVLLNPETSLSLLGAIVTGIGFLGAGALIRTTDKVFGFTSAASIWIFAIIGLIIGVGEYLIGGIMYIIVWLVMLVDSFLESMGIGSYRRKLVITLNKNIHAGELANILRTKNYKIINIDINLKKKQYVLTLYVEGPRNVVNRIPRRLDTLSHVIGYKIE